MVNKTQVENDLLEILEISAKVVEKTKAFAVDGRNMREYRISILSIAKIVQEQYNYQRGLDNGKNIK